MGRIKTWLTDIYNWLEHIWLYKIKYHLKEIPHIVPSIILCLRFPFLYPRHRLYGKHYVNYNLIKYHREHWEEAYELKPQNPEDEIGRWTVKEGKKWLAFKIQFVDWIHDHPLQWLHCIPTYTELDAMPDGWRKAFGIELCKELKECLLRHGGRKLLREVRVLDIKEKYGQLSMDFSNLPEEGWKIIQKYEYISERTCIVCGRVADWFTTGWLSPYCDEHLPEYDRGTAEKYREDIDWYGWKIVKLKEKTDTE